MSAPEDKDETRRIMAGKQRTEAVIRAARELGGVNAWLRRVVPSVEEIEAAAMVIYEQLYPNAPIAFGDLIYDAVAYYSEIARLVLLAGLAVRYPQPEEQT